MNWVSWILTAVFVILALFFVGDQGILKIVTYFNIGYFGADVVRDLIRVWST